MSLFSDTDPSGTHITPARGQYLSFARSFLCGDSNAGYNLLYVYGDGNNGKTTLFETVKRSSPDKVACVPFPISNHRFYEKIIAEGISFVRINNESADRGDLSGQIIEEINGFVARYPNVGFIIESNYQPPDELKCIKLLCKERFNDKSFNVLDHVETIAIQ